MFDVKLGKGDKINIYMSSNYDVWKVVFSITLSFHCTRVCICFVNNRCLQVGLVRMKNCVWQQRYVL